MGIRAAWERGLFTVARWPGGALRVHGSMLLLLLLTAAGPTATGIGLSLVALIIFHELGHVAALKLCGGRLIGLDLAPVVGVTRYADTLSPAKTTFVAWGGIAAQALLFIAALVVAKLLPLAEHPYADGLAVSWIIFNPVIAFINLLPLEPLDGFQAWAGLRRTARRVQIDVDAQKLGLTGDSQDELLHRGDVPDELQKAIDQAVSNASASQPAFPMRPGDGSMRN